jgi:pimeloyl-ACP methyl ester carboxylesterase
MAAKASEHTISLNGIEMFYRMIGEGEPLLLLHGFTGCADDWRFFTDDLAREYRCIIPDLRGHGRSTNPSNEFTHHQAALDVYALLDSLGIERFKAIGISAGGNAMLHMATMQPGRVDAMVIVSATPYFPAQARAVMAQFSAERMSEAEWNVARSQHRHGDDQIRALYAQGRGFKDSYHDLNFTPPLLATITARTLIVYGDRDFLYPLQMAFELCSGIAGSHLWVVPNGGHGPVFGDLAPPFTTTSMAFLRGDWERK